MRKVEISYNPYMQRASLWVDKEKYAHAGSRIVAFVTGRPMEQWISDYSVSYKHWDGFLPELTEELNDDELDLVFWGILEDYETFSAGIAKTYDDVRMRGFEPERCRLSWKLKYAPDQMLHLLCKFARQQLAMLTGQMEIIRMESFCNRLEEADAMSIAQVREMIKSLEDFFQDVAVSGKTQKIEDYWHGVTKRFIRMCEEGR